MKLDKRLEFIIPFLKEVEHLVPIKKITRIFGYTVPLNKHENTYGSCITTGGKFSINLLITLNNYKRKKQSYIYLDLFLIALAHELVHTKYDDHDDKFFALQSLIQLHFANILKKQKVKDTYIRIDKLWKNKKS